MSPRIILVLLIAVLRLTVQAQSLSDAFNQGTTLGRSGNAAARTQINGSTAQSSVPGYTANPPQASYFGSPGISAPAAAAANACPDAGSTGGTGNYGAQACNAVNFSQTNPTRRPLFSIAPRSGIFSSMAFICALTFATLPRWFTRSIQASNRDPFGGR